MIFLYSIFHGTTGVIRERGPIKEHCEMFFTFTAPCISEEYDAYTNDLLKFHSLDGSVYYEWNRHKKDNFRHEEFFFYTILNKHSNGNQL